MASDVLLTFYIIYLLLGVSEYVGTEICTSRQKRFSLVTFVDTPGLVDGDMKYPFDVDKAILWLGVCSVFQIKSVFKVTHMIFQTLIDFMFLFIIIHEQVLHNKRVVDFMATDYQDLNCLDFMSSVFDVLQGSCAILSLFSLTRWDKRYANVH